ncbi:MAG: hypothetical protein JWL71_1839, partial [Acidobacteria bacterium]|nr:hypothetical protein [Acidobacteriota bacterium]
MALLVLDCCGNVSDRNRLRAAHWPREGHFFYNALMNKPRKLRYASCAAVAMLMMVFVSVRAQQPPAAPAQQPPARGTAP